MCPVFLSELPKTFKPQRVNKYSRRTLLKKHHRNQFNNIVFFSKDPMKTRESQKNPFGTGINTVALTSKRAA